MADMAKIKIYRGGVIKIPRDLREIAGIKENSPVICIAEKGKIIIMPCQEPCHKEVHNKSSEGKGVS